MRNRTPICYLHHLEATGGGTLRYIEYLVEISPPDVHFLLFDRKEVDLSSLRAHENVTITPSPQNIVLRVISIYLHTWRHIRNLRPQNIHAHSTISGLVVRILRIFHRFNCMYTPHCYSFTYPGPLRQICWVTERLLARIPCAYVHVSKHDYSVGKRLNNTNHSKVIYSPYDPGKGRVDPERTFEARTVLLVGSNRRQKGYEILRVLAEALNRHACGFELLVAGAKPSCAEVRCIPWQTDLGDYYQSSFCLLNVSYGEGLSLAIIDAMHAGLPVVAFDIEPNRELLEGGAGVLVEQRNVQSLASEILALGRNFERYSMFHQRSISRAQELFSPRMFLLNYSKHYVSCGVNMPMDRIRAAESARCSAESRSCLVSPRSSRL